MCWKKIIADLKGNEKFDLEKIIADLKGNEEFDLKKAPEEISKEIEKLIHVQGYMEKVAKNPEKYPDVISLLCLHMHAVKGELFSDYLPEKQKIILENAVYASIKAYSIAKKLGERELGASYMGMAGNALYRLRMFIESEKAYKKALKIYRDLEKENPEKFKLGVAITLDNIGTFYSNTGKFSQAEDMYDEALKIMEELVQKDSNTYNPHKATTLNNLGNFYKNAGKFFEAEVAYTKALEMREDLAEKEKNPKMYEPVAVTHNCLGLLYFDVAELSRAKEEYEKALKKYKEALEIYRGLEKRRKQDYTPYIAGCLNNIGNCHMKMEELSHAKEAYEEALEKYRILENHNPAAYTPHVAASLNNLGVLCNATKGPFLAKKTYNEALERYKKALMWSDASRTCYNLSTVESDSETLEKSRKLLELAILFSEEEEYRYAQKRANESMYLRLLGKNMSTFGVLEALRDPQLLSLSWDESPSQEELRRARSDVEFQKHLVERMLKEQVPYREPPEGFLEDSIFIYIQRIGNQLSLFTVENGGTRKFKCKRKFFVLGNKLLLLFTYQQMAAGKERCKKYVEEFETLAKQWYETLPKELRISIQEKNHIIFSVDSYCSSLPLEALQIDDQPLCIEKTMIRATSLHQFSSSLKKTPRFDSSLIIGNPWPKCDEKELKYALPSGSNPIRICFLQKAVEEAEVLAGQLPNATLLLGYDATGGQFLLKIKQHSIIHFCGHGNLGRILFFSGPLEGFPSFEPEEFSNLRKAERTEGTKKINMMKEWYPVTDLDLLKVELTKGVVVFLNACETGRHKYAGGGYYQGLPAVFLKNGAHSVISSLIPLFDEESKEFSLIFYGELLKTHSVSQSLKKARICIRKAYESQVHWIPYLHYGSPF